MTKNRAETEQSHPPANQSFPRSLESATVAECPEMSGNDRQTKNFGLPAPPPNKPHEEKAAKCPT